jgi:hypothetical protein
MMLLTQIIAKCQLVQGIRIRLSIDQSVADRISLCGGHPDEGISGWKVGMDVSAKLKDTSS